MRMVILSFAALLSVIPIGHYLATTRNESRLYDQLLATIIPHASYSDAPLSRAAHDIWMRTSMQNPDFIGSKLIVDVHVDPKVTFEYGHCPSLEWFRDLVSGHDIHLTIDNRALILSQDPEKRDSEWFTDRWIESAREAAWRVQYTIRTWLNPPSPDDPFASDRAQQGEGGKASPATS